MSVQFEPAYGCWTYRCIFGCFEYDYEGEAEARDAFVGHGCVA